MKAVYFLEKKLQITTKIAKDVDNYYKNPVK